MSCSSPSPVSCVQVKELFTGELCSSQVEQSFTGELFRSSQVKESLIPLKGKCGCHTEMTNKRQ